MEVRCLLLFRLHFFLRHAIFWKKAKRCRRCTLGVTWRRISYSSCLRVSSGSVARSRAACQLHIHHGIRVVIAAKWQCPPVRRVHMLWVPNVGFSLRPLSLWRRSVHIDRRVILLSTIHESDNIIIMMIGNEDDDELRDLIRLGVTFDTRKT